MRVRAIISILSRPVEQFQTFRESLNGDDFTGEAQALSWRLLEKTLEDGQPGESTLVDCF